jgi:hypothetical protein
MATARVSKASILRDLQDRLNTNTRARTSFLKDPGRVLRDQGIELTPARERQLTAFLANQTAIAGGRVAGAAIRPGAANSVEVEVTVKVKF